MMAAPAGEGATEDLGLVAGIDPGRDASLDDSSGAEEVEVGAGGESRYSTTAVVPQVGARFPTLVLYHMILDDTMSVLL